MNNKLVSVKRPDKNGRMVTRHVINEVATAPKTKAVPRVGELSKHKQFVIDAIQHDMTSQPDELALSTAYQKKVLRNANELPARSLKYIAESLAQAGYSRKLEIGSSLVDMLGDGMPAARIEDVVFALQNVSWDFHEGWAGYGSGGEPEYWLGSEVVDSLSKVLRGYSTYRLDELPYDFDKAKGKPVRTRDNQFKSAFAALTEMTLEAHISGGSFAPEKITVDGKQAVVFPVEDVRMFLRHPNYFDRLSVLYTNSGRSQVTELLELECEGNTGAMISLIEAAFKARWRADWDEMDRVNNGGDFNEETGEVTYKIDLYGPRIAKLAATYPDKTDAIAEFVNRWNDGIIPAHDSEALARFMEFDSPALREGMI